MPPTAFACPQAPCFLVVATDTAHRHVEAQLHKGISEGHAAAVTDVTGAYAQINLQGPHSRELLSKLTSADCSDAAFPFRAAKRIDIGCASLMATRITYVGELGCARLICHRVPPRAPRVQALLGCLSATFLLPLDCMLIASRLHAGCLSMSSSLPLGGRYELFVPSEMAVHVYDEIVRLGEAEHGLVHCGLKARDCSLIALCLPSDCPLAAALLPADHHALELCGLQALGSLRMEKGYRDYGHDLDNLDTLLEAGLGFTADYEKPGGFVGIEPTRAQKARGMAALPRRLVQVVLDDPAPLMYHGEVVYRDGAIVGDVRAASYGHTLGGAVGLSMIEGVDEPITPAWLREGTWEVDVAGVRYPARASLRPLYDPKNEKIKA